LEQFPFSANLNLKTTMKLSEQQRALKSVIAAAKSAGEIMRKNLRAEKKVNVETSHDIKLELDVRCQNLIEKKLRVDFPEIALLGEEGVSGAQDAELRWVVDPIDGTVNFAHGIPHACVSIALQRKVSSSKKHGRKSETPEYETLIGVVYDPFTDELWTAIRGQAARLNGKIIRVSAHRDLAKCIVSIGFAKSRSSLESALPYFTWLARRVQKIRMLGSAALGLTYVATGRLDAYIERGVNIWDIAAGGLIIECAGGKFWTESTGEKNRFRMIASNGLLHGKLPTPE
jgi:myo-inositol-1(or 4)-monophosphatase